MARARQASEPPMSLFAFLSVLVCAIGVMSFVVCGQSALAISTAKQQIDVRHDVGSEHDMRPVYIEVREDGLLVHNDGEGVLPEPIHVSCEACERVERHIDVLLELPETHEGARAFSEGRPVPAQVRQTVIAKMRDEYAGEDLVLWNLFLELLEERAGAPRAGDGPAPGSEPAEGSVAPGPRLPMPPRTRPAPAGPAFDGPAPAETAEPAKDRADMRYIVFLIRPGGTELYHKFRYMMRVLGLEAGKDALLGLGELELTDESLDEGPQSR